MTALTHTPLPTTEPPQAGSPRIRAAAREKLALNEQRYPVELARGNALKYDRLTEAGEQA